MNKKILASLLVVGVVAAVAGGSTFALFNDTETSEDNTFAAGELDLTVDWNETYNGEQVEYQPAANINGTPIFELDDIKPGDTGHAQVSLNNEANPAHVYMNATNTEDLENGCTEPEQDVDNSCGEGAEGELQDHLEFTIYNDSNENGEQDGGEEVFYEGTAADLQLENVYLGEFDSEETRCIGVAWNVPIETGNVIQGDSKVMDFSFYAEQSRHNPVNGEDPGEQDENTTPVNWQVDLSQGEVIEDLSAQTYGDDLERAAHGTTNESGVYRVSEQDFNRVSCIVEDQEIMERSDNTADVSFSIDDDSDCENMNVTFSSYLNSGTVGWQGPADGADMTLEDHVTENVSAGADYNLTVDLPEPQPTP